MSDVRSEPLETCCRQIECTHNFTELDDTRRLTESARTVPRLMNLFVTAHVWIT